MSSSTDMGPHFPNSSESKRAAPPRLSPDFRNGDFLSRLLAATPPYLYNMPLVPHSFFFSDMLKSFVQGKPPEQPTAPPRDTCLDFSLPHPPSETPPAKDLPGRPPHRRRKRTWREMSEPPRFMIDRKPPPPLDKPLELTNNNRSAPPSHENKVAINRMETSPSRMISPSLDRSSTSPANIVDTSSPPNLPPPPPPLMIPNMPPCGMLPLPGSDFHPNRLPSSSSDTLPTDLMPSLPPFPPPMWYPGLYPGIGPNMPPQPPFGIDPLHFFIDLRVSGHIWDRKPPFGMPGVGSPTGLDCTMGKESPLENSSRVIELDKSPNSEEQHHLAGPLNLASTSNFKPSLQGLILGNGSKNSKHTSAFSVPEPRPNSVSNKKGHKLNHTDSPQSSSKKKLPTTNYVLQNLSRIYQDMDGKKSKTEESDGEESRQSADLKEREEEKKSSVGETADAERATAGENGEAPCKDLPALIGLELVVDYVKHDGKSGPKRTTAPTTPPAGDIAPQITASQPSDNDRVTPSPRCVDN